MSEKSLSLRQLAGAENAFSESDSLWKVDIVDWATTSPEFQEIILQKYVVQGVN